jgi:catechol 2,3-dioxygenase-like lactoylglutathione lyase family enzyme
MIGYITIGTNDLPRATAFYDAVLAILGARRTMTLQRGYAWGGANKGPSLMVMTPHNGQLASGGNGTMVALVANDRQTVDAVYRRAIEQGATCEGPPGDRGGNFYAAYFRDLDGNKLNCFHF